MNDLQVSIGHMERLIKDITSSELIANNFMDSEVRTVEDEVQSLQDINQKVKSTLKVRFLLCYTFRHSCPAQSGIDQLFNQLIRPRLRTFLTDTYRDVSYLLDDDAYSASEQQDIVRKRFVKNWEDVTQGLKVRCTHTLKCISSYFT